MIAHKFLGTEFKEGSVFFFVFFWFFRFRNEKGLFWIRCELFAQWGLLSKEKSARNHNVNTVYCRQTMFFKYRKDNRQQDQK